MLINRYKNVIKVAVLCLTVSLLSFILGAKIASKPSYVSINTDVAEQQDTSTSKIKPKVNPDNGIETISQLMETINDFYVEEPDFTKLVEGALKGMTQALDDPYSVFMYDDEYEDFMINLNGSFEGVGIVITSDEETGDVLVSYPIEGGPAQKSGIIEGDKILKVDDIPMTGKTIEEVAKILRGPKGTKVTLQIQRQGNPNVMKFELTRESIVMKTVSWEMLDSSTAYIKILSFDTSTSEQFNEALEKIEQNKAKRLILDLRNNPGGSLYEAVKVADKLLGKGLVVYTEDRYKNKIEEYYSDEERISLPLVVLINRNSASASEIVAGAVQDHNAGTLVGEKSFGKGSVQELIPFGDVGALKLTIAKYYIPSGRCIDGIGIEPDIEVELPKGVSLYDIPTGKDAQLIKAQEVVEKIAEGFNQ